MTEITREMLAKALNSRTKRTNNAIIALIIPLVLGLFAAESSFLLPEDLQIIALLLLIVILVLVFVIFARIMEQPEEGSKGLKAAFKTVSGDFTSDSVLSRLREKIGKTDNFSDKTILSLMLCEVYCARGNYNEAIDILSAVDRSKLIGCPYVGLHYYETVAGIYSALDLGESVLAAFADAGPFIDECAGRSFACCMTALRITIYAEKAKGNYPKALKLRLMANEFENEYKSSPTARFGNTEHKITPYEYFLSGKIFFETAELFYLCGDDVSAAKYLDTGGPMLSASPAMTERANKLSAKLRETSVQ